MFGTPQNIFWDHSERFLKGGGGGRGGCTVGPPGSLTNTFTYECARIRSTAYTYRTAFTADTMQLKRKTKPRRPPTTTPTKEPTDSPIMTSFTAIPRHAVLSVASLSVLCRHLYKGVERPLADSVTGNISAQSFVNMTA